MLAVRPRVQDGYSDAVTQEIRLVSLLPAGPPVLLPPAGSPPEWGPHSQFCLW